MTKPYQKIITEQIMQDGRERLERLLPDAIDMIKNHHESVPDGFAFNEEGDLYSHIRMDNLKAVIIYGDDAAGWWTDVVFAKVPADTSDSMGTPTNTPYPTKAEAELAALPLLSMIVAVALGETRRARLKLVNGFTLYGESIPLLKEMLEAVHDLAAKDASFKLDQATACARLDRTIAELFPTGFSADEFMALPRRAVNNLLVVLHYAAASGLASYPPASSAH